MFACSELQHSEENGWFMYANLVGQFGKVEHQYECVTTFGLVDESQASTLKKYQGDGGLFATNKKEEVLYQMLLDAGDQGKKFLLRMSNAYSKTLNVRERS